MKLGNLNTSVMNVLQSCNNRAQSLLDKFSFLMKVDKSYLCLDDTILPYRLTSVVDTLIKFLNGTSDQFDGKFVRYIAGEQSYNDQDFFEIVEYIKWLFDHGISLKQLSDYLNHALRVELNERSCDTAFNIHFNYVDDLKKYESINNEILQNDIILTRTYRSHLTIFKTLTYPKSFDTFKKNNAIFFNI